MERIMQDSSLEVMQVLHLPHCTAPPGSDHSLRLPQCSSRLKDLKTFLTWWPWPLTLTFDLDLDIIPLDLHTKIQVHMSVRFAVRVATDRHTARHTHRRCQNYYTRHVKDVGCKKRKESNLLGVVLWGFHSVMSTLFQGRQTKVLWVKGLSILVDNFCSRFEKDVNVSVQICWLYTKVWKQNTMYMYYILLFTDMEYYQV